MTEKTYCISSYSIKLLKLRLRKNSTESLIPFVSTTTKNVTWINSCPSSGSKKVVRFIRHDYKLLAFEIVLQRR